MNDFGLTNGDKIFTLLGCVALACVAGLMLALITWVFVPVGGWVLTVVGISAGAGAMVGLILGGPW